MKTPKLLLLGAILIYAVPFALAQGFLNLDFESANLTPIPPGQYGDFVPISDALPSWVGYVGTNQVTTAWQNNFSLGSAVIDIIGPDWNNSVIQIIEGEYTVALQAGFVGTNVTSAAIAQTSLIPLTAESLQFKTGTDVFPYEVTIDGQIIPMIPLSTTATYTLLGGNISAFKGQVRELRIVAIPGNFVFTVDSIEFSTQIVPEPSAIGLFALGSLLLASRRLK